MNEIGIVTMTGVDLEDDGNIRITVHSIQPYGSVMESASKPITWVGSAKGKSIMDASKNLRAIATKKLLWLHNSIIIVGEKMAEEKLSSMLDFFHRNREIRYNSYILITEGTAYEMLQVPADIQSSLTNELEGIINNQEEWSRAYVSDLKDFLVAYSEPYSSIVTGRVGYYDSERNSFSASREEFLGFSDEKSLGIAFIEGLAVFDNSSLAGWLNGDESRGYMWVTNKVNNGAIVCMMDNENQIVMEKTTSKSKVTIKEGMDGLYADMDIKVKGMLVEQSNTFDIEHTKKLEDLEKLFRTSIESDIMAAIKKSKEYHADIFGLWKNICKKCPGMQAKYQPIWGEVFEQIKFNIKVDVTLERSGMIINGITIEGE